MTTAVGSIARAALAGIKTTPHAGPQIVAVERPDELLDEVELFLDRFVAYPTDHARVAHVLWVAHAHLMDLWESTPRIAFLSHLNPEAGNLGRLR